MVLRSLASSSVVSKGQRHTLFIGGDGGVPTDQQLVDRHREAFFRRGLIEVRRCEADLVFVFLLALPDGPFVLLRRVPDLRAVPATAVTALDPAG